MAGLLVLDQTVPLREGPPTAAAAVWSVCAVDLLVSLQTLLPAEVPVAEPAVVRFLSGVGPSVDLHHLDRAAPLPAYITGANQLFVGLQVVSKGLGGIQTFTTGPTPVLRLLAVELSVPDQKPLCEGHFADSAAERPERYLERDLLSAEAAGHLVLRHVLSDVFSQSPL